MILSCCFVSSCFVANEARNACGNFWDFVMEVEQSGHAETPIHLKPVIYQKNSMLVGIHMQIQVDW